MIARPESAYPFADRVSFVAVGSKSGGLCFVVLLALPRARSHLSHGRGSRGGSSVLSLRRPRQRVRAFNAGQCTAPVCPLFTCSRPSQSSHGRKGPEAFPPVALCRPGYLSSGQPSLAFLCTPPSLSNHPQLGCELLSPCHLLPPLPLSGASVKAVPQSSSLSGFCSLSSLLLQWN